MKTYQQLNEDIRESNEGSNFSEEKSIYQLLIAEDLSKEDYSSIFRALNDNSLTGIYIMENGILTYVNSVLTNMYGYSKEEVIGKSLLEFVHPDDRANVIKIIQAFISGEDVDTILEFRGVKKNGDIIYLQEFSGINSSISGNIIFGNIIDITEKKKIELELEEYRKNLEQKVEQRTNELIQANKKLELEISERKKIESDLKRIQFELEKRIFDRTKELIEANDTLSKEIELNNERQKKLQKIFCRSNNRFGSIRTNRRI